MAFPIPLFIVTKPSETDQNREDDMTSTGISVTGPTLLNQPVSSTPDAT